jgi:hypothetical protein
MVVSNDQWIAPGLRNPMLAMVECLILMAEWTAVYQGYRPAIVDVAGCRLIGYLVSAAWPVARFRINPVGLLRSPGSTSLKTTKGY